MLLLWVWMWCGGAVAAEWPQWRGSTGNGVSTEKNVPLEWSGTKNVAWKTEIPGIGHSQPVVWKDRIFLTSDIEGEAIPGAKAPVHFLKKEAFLHPDSMGANKKHTLLVMALDRANGKILWQRTAYEGAVFDNRHKRGSYASPTPVTDGETIYAYFGSEGIYAYDFSGKLRWKNSPGKLMTVGMGPGSSPAIDGNLIFLQCDQNDGEGSFLMALNRATGKEVWTTARKNQVTWSSPVIADTGARHELIAMGSESTIGYDPQTGKELWRANGVVGNAVGTPLVGHGMVYVASGYPDKKTFALKLGLSGDQGESKAVVWKYEKGTAYVPSNILVGDYIYLITDKGLLTCLDANTGALQYEGKRVPVPASFMASPVAVGDKILLTSTDGDTYVIQAGPEHSVVRTNSIGEPVSASLAIAGGRIYIRAEKHLYAISSN
jgi:outer membrane protein assembly factor BamB